MANLSDYFPDYHPAMMKFDGTSGYYSKSSITTTGNDVLTIVRFKVASFAGNELNVLTSFLSSAGTSWRTLIRIGSNDWSADSDVQDRVYIVIQNSATTVICRLISNINIADNVLHTLFFSFDGDTGAFIFKIDGEDADATGWTDRITPVSGTLSNGASATFGVGATQVGGDKIDGEISYCGFRDVYLTNWNDFMDAKGNPKELDESGWAEWGAQPLFWNEHGDMINNLGTGGDMTKNGTIVVGKGGN